TLRAGLADLAPRALDLLRPVEKPERFVAAVLLDERAAEGVVCGGLVQLARAVQFLHGLPGHLFRLRPAALAQERRRLIGQLLARPRAPRPRGGRGGRRGWRWRNGRRRLLRHGLPHRRRLALNCGLPHHRARLRLPPPPSAPAPPSP